MRNGSADYTAVLGYTSTYLSTVTIPIGKDNNLTVSPDAPQPTSFQPGTHHGVLSIQVTTPTASWTLDGNTLLVTASGADSCSAGVVMPATGNGTGLAIGLAVAGVIGALVVRRWRRRALPSSQPDPSIGARSSGVPAPQPPTASMRGRHRAGSPALPPEGTAVEASASGPPASVLVGSGSRSS